MINIAASLCLAILISAIFMLLSVSGFIAIPFGLVGGFVLFFFLGRKIQEKMEILMAQMQKDVAENKFDRAIETLKRGFAFSKRHIFVAAQLNSQIGVLYYLKKDHDKSMEYLKKGFLKHYVGQGMLACIYYKRKDMENMKSTMEDTIKGNRKEAMVYGLYAYLVYQLKEKDKAIEILQNGLKKLPKDTRLQANLTQLQNNKKMKMKVFGDAWVQFMLERPPRVMQNQPPHARMSKRAMFR